MFTPLLRILLVIGCFCIAIYHYSKEEYLSMTLIVFGAFLFIYGYFKAGTVYIAFQALKKEDYDKAEKLISKIKNPDLLSKGQKSYYHFTQGAIASHKEKWEKSYIEWSNALSIGLRTENDTSIALLNIANVEYERKNFENAIEFISKLRELKLKPIVKSETDRIENEIKVAQQHV